MTKRYHPPETPCERLLSAETVPDDTKVKLREVGSALDPLQLLEEVRAMQSHMVVLADGGKPHVSSVDQPDLSAFMASLSSAWRSGEVRPTHSVEAKPRYLRRIQTLVHRDAVAPRQIAPPSQTKVVNTDVRPIVTPDRPSVPKLDPEVEQQCELQRQELARLHIQRRHAFTLIWPLVCRRLESRPNINASELFDELRAQYPGRFHCGQLNAFIHRVRLWRDDARARGCDDRQAHSPEHKISRPPATGPVPGALGRDASASRRRSRSNRAGALDRLPREVSRSIQRPASADAAALTKNLAARGGPTVDLRDARLYYECWLRTRMIVMASTHRILPSVACGVRPHCAEMVKIFVRQMVRKLREATRSGDSKSGR